MTTPTARPPRVLAIAGSDSSGGAGIQADIKTVTMLGGYAMTAITAITAQNSVGVQATEVLSPALVIAQIDSCLNDIGADALKVGMLGSPKTAHAVADRLGQVGLPVVFDPVMVATSGAVLADADTIAAFERLMALASLTTPNIAEVTALGGVAGLTARKVPFLAKGGDADGETVEDVLHRPQQEPLAYHGARIDTRHTHGTGCTLSSAIALFLARGLPLPEAIDRARGFVRSALRAAPGFGAGHGPMGHAQARG